MSTRIERVLSREQVWRRRLQERERSGMSVRAYCRTHDLTEASFYFWRRRLGRVRAEAPGFVPVRVVPDEPAAVPAGIDAGLELVVPGGRVLRIGSGFDAATLRRLLAFLEEGQS